MYRNAARPEAVHVNAGDEMQSCLRVGYGICRCLRGRQEFVGRVWVRILGQWSGEVNVWVESVRGNRSVGIGKRGREGRLCSEITVRTVGAGRATVGAL